MQCPLAHLPILYLRTVVLESVDIYKNVKISQRQPINTMAMKSSIPIRKDYLISLLESKDYQIKQTEWNTYFN